MRMVFETAKAFGANGIILWGSSSDLTTKYDFYFVTFVFIFMIHIQYFLNNHQRQMYGVRNVFGNSDRTNFKRICYQI